MVSRSAGHKARVGGSLVIISQAFAVAGDWYVSVSGGKDSTVVLDLARSLRPEIAAQHSARHFILPETRAYLDRIPNLRFIAYQGIGDTDFGQSWNSHEEAALEYADVKWLTERSAIKVRGADEDGVFLGLRADENAYRRKHLRAQGRLFRNSETEKWQSNPIAFWSVWDVWAYIYSHDLDYSAAYDRLSAIGVDIEQQRTGPLAVERALGMGQLAWLKRGWPSLFNEYAAVHPEARAYA